MKNSSNKIKIGVSACLLGDEVRYNGQASEDRFITKELIRYFDYIKVCPEVGIGLGIPRETIRLVKKNDEVRLLNHSGNSDYTEQMKDFAFKRIKQFGQERISGFIFKKSSPSCGAFRVKVYNEQGVTQAQSSSGMFAGEFKRKYPW